MFFLAGSILLVYGYSQCAFKDFWWWDQVVFWQALGRTVTRTESWERDLNTWGFFCMAAGICLILYALVG